MTDMKTGEVTHLPRYGVWDEIRVIDTSDDLDYLLQKYGLSQKDVFSINPIYTHLHKNKGGSKAEIFNLQQQRKKRNPLTRDEVKRVAPFQGFIAVKELVAKTKKDGRKVSFGPDEEYTVEQLGELMRVNPGMTRYIVRDFGRNFTRAVMQVCEADGMQ